MLPTFGMRGPLCRYAPRVNGATPTRKHLSWDQAKALAGRFLAADVTLDGGLPQHLVDQLDKSAQLTERAASTAAAETGLRRAERRDFAPAIRVSQLGCVVLTSSHRWLCRHIDAGFIARTGHPVVVDVDRAVVMCIACARSNVWRIEAPEVFPDTCDVCGAEVGAEELSPNAIVHHSVTYSYSQCAACSNDLDPPPPKPNPFVKP